MLKEINDRKAVLSGEHCIGSSRALHVLTILREAVLHTSPRDCKYTHSTASKEMAKVWQSVAPVQLDGFVNDNKGHWLKYTEVFQLSEKLKHLKRAEGTQGLLKRA